MVTLSVDLRLALSPAAFARHCGFDLDDWQAEVLESPSDRVILLCSRQSGKSLTAALLATHQAIFLPLSLILLIAPTRAQSGELLRTIRDVVDRSGVEAHRAQDNQKTLEFDNGSRIVVVAADSGTLRGYSAVDLLVFDEAGWVGDPVFDAASPMLAVSRGRMLMLSTPNGARGRFWEAWANGGSIWHRVSVRADQVPRIDPGWLTRERDRLPASIFAAEYECAFTEAASGAFTESDIAAALVEKVETWVL